MAGNGRTRGAQQCKVASVQGMGEPDVDPPILFADVKRRLIEGGWTAHDTSAADVEARAVPGAGDDVAL